MDNQALVVPVLATQHGPPENLKEDEERYGITEEPSNAKRGTTENRDAEPTASRCPP